MKFITLKTKHLAFILLLSVISINCFEILPIKEKEIANKKTQAKRRVSAHRTLTRNSSSPASSSSSSSSSEATGSSSGNSDLVTEVPKYRQAPLPKDMPKEETITPTDERILIQNDLTYDKNNLKDGSSHTDDIINTIIKEKSNSYPFKVDLVANKVIKRDEINHASEFLPDEFKYDKKETVLQPPTLRKRRTNFNK